jgi:hypothetical protein
MESLTLTLDYTRPMIWFARLGERRFAVAWTVISAIFFFFSGTPMLGGALAFLVDLWRNTLRAQAQILLLVDAENEHLIAVGLYIFIALNLLAVLITFWQLGSRVTTFLASEGRIGIFIARLLVIYAITAGVAFALMNGAIYFGKTIWYAVIGIPGLLVLPVPIVIVTIGMLMVSLSLLLFIVELLFKVARAICWRIVEYSKGSWAAVIAILTAALGIYKAFLS